MFFPITPSTPYDLCTMKTAIPVRYLAEDEHMMTLGLELDDQTIERLKLSALPEERLRSGTLGSILKGGVDQIWVVARIWPIMSFSSSLDPLSSSCLLQLCHDFLQEVFHL